MPWKHDSVNSRRTGRWQRLSKQTRKGEPLCRLCLSAGRVEPATVVDHIVPIAEGGTHETENLMPLCKRCHDTIKTPADNSQMARQVPCLLRLASPSLRSAMPCTINAIEMRFSLAEKVAMSLAHEITSAAIDGVARACRQGAVSGRGVSIVIDDSALARKLATVYGCEVEEIATHADETKAEGKHGSWIEAFRSSERARRAEHRVGNQEPRSGSDQRGDA